MYVGYRVQWCSLKWTPFPGVRSRSANPLASWLRAARLRPWIHPIKLRYAAGAVHFNEHHCTKEYDRGRR